MNKNWKKLFKTVTTVMFMVICMICAVCTWGFIILHGDKVSLSDFDSMMLLLAAFTSAGLLLAVSGDLLGFYDNAKDDNILSNRRELYEK